MADIVMIRCQRCSRDDYLLVEVEGVPVCSVCLRELDPATYFALRGRYLAEIERERAAAYLRATQPCKGEARRL